MYTDSHISSGNLQRIVGFPQLCSQVSHSIMLASVTLQVKYSSELPHSMLTQGLHVVLIAL